MTNGRRFVLAGLSATGKTTALRALAKSPDVTTVPEHNDWIGGSQNFPKAPKTIEEKKAKQRFFLQIDLELQKWVTAHLGEHPYIISDSDFTSPLAHNYAERWLIPELDIYAWLVETYCEMLQSGQLSPASLYIYLDATLEQRRERRLSEMTVRRRNDMFFTEPFPTRMRRFYWVLMHPDSPRAVLPACWHSHDGSCDEELPRIRSAMESSAQRPKQEVDIQALIEVLRSTISDSPDMP